MPAKSKIKTELAPEDREQLEKKLVENGFSGYDELTAWLNALGYKIGKSSVHRYGQDFEQRIQAFKIVTEQAKAIVHATPDDEGAVNDALIRLTQEKVFTILLDYQIDPEKVDINKLTRAVADLARSSVSQKRFAAEARKQAQEEAKRAAAAEAGKIVKEMGLDEEQAGFLRAQILGVKVKTEDGQQ